jgi:hypothetical protein
MYKSTKILWIGHVVRMDKGRTVKIIKEWSQFAVSRIGRARIR